MPGWMNHKLELRLPGEISTTSEISTICRWYDSNGRKLEELKSLMMRVKEKSGKAGLKFNILKTNIMASGSITSWQIEGEKWKQ